MITEPRKALNEPHLTCIDHSTDRSNKNKSNSKGKVKVKVHTIDTVPLCSESPPQKRSGMARVLKGFQFYLHTHMFIHNRNEPYLPMPSQLSLVLIYQPRRDGRLSRPWCKVAPAKIWTCKLPDCKSSTLPQPLVHVWMAPEVNVLPAVLNT